jgi:hypothetical protein
MLIVHSIISTTWSRLRNNLLVSYIPLLPAALFFTKHHAGYLQSLCNAIAMFCEESH